MPLEIFYGDRRVAWGRVDVTGGVRLGRVSFESRAEMGGIGSCSIAFDDLTGTFGHSGDQIMGLKTLVAEEWEAPANNQRIFTGYIHDRTYTVAESLITGSSVRIEAQLADINDEARYYIVRGVNTPSLATSNGNRLAETVGDRLRWLLGSVYIALDDNGAVVYPTTMMEASDYRGRTGADVLDDCAQLVGYNWFIYIDEAAGNGISLWFDNPNTSTAWSSNLRISNDITDRDSTIETGAGPTQTWAPHYVKLTRSPEHTASGQYFVYKSGSVFVERTATADTYGRVDATTADSSVTTSSGATTRANRLLNLSKDEEDLIEVSLDLPPANVNDVREGQRMQLKTRNLPGYTSDYSWFRVLRRIVAQEQQTPDFYTVTMTLSPQADTASTIVQTAAERHQLVVTFDSPTKVGSLLVTIQAWRQLLTTPNPPLGETWTYLGQGDFVDDHDAPDPCSMVAYATIVTTPATTYTKQGATGGDANGTCVHSVTKEYSGLAISDLVTLTSGPNAPATTLAIGSVGDCSQAFGGWGDGWDGFSTSPTGTRTVGFGDFTMDYIASRDQASTTSNPAFLDAFPCAAYGHASNASGVVGTVTISDDQTPHHWGGVVVYVP